MLHDLNTCLVEKWFIDMDANIPTNNSELHIISLRVWPFIAKHTTKACLCVNQQWHAAPD